MLTLNQSIAQSQYQTEINQIFEKNRDLQLINFNQDGANGEIILAKNIQLDRNVAIKIYDHDKDPKTHEPTLVAQIDHENIIKVYDAGLLKAGTYSTSYYVMEYAQQNLKDFLSHSLLSISAALKLFKNLLSGLSCFHSKQFNLVHRDLKPENLLIVDDCLKIGDFGSVKKLNSVNKTFVSKHSILYRPPESFGTLGFFDKKSDIYQAGMILLELIGHKLDTNGENYLLSRDRIRYSQLQNESEKSIFIDKVIENRISSNKLINLKDIAFYIDQGLISILRKMICPYDKRYSCIADVLAALNKYEKVKKDWQIDEAQNLTLYGFKGKDYLILSEKNQFILKHRRKSLQFTQIPNTDFFTTQKLAYEALIKVLC